MKKSILLIIMALFSSIFLSACNTVSGVGKDVSAVGNATGEALTNASNATANEIKKVAN